MEQENENQVFIDLYNHYISIGTPTVGAKRLIYLFGGVYIDKEGNMYDEDEI